MWSSVNIQEAPNKVKGNMEDILEQVLSELSPEE